MADLDTLRPEVRGALDGLSYFLTGTHNHNDFYIIRAELLWLAMIEADALIALDCEHDWQVMRERAEKAEAELAAALKANRDCVDHFEQMQAELAALKARIAEAPVVACPKTLVHAGNTMQTEFLEYTHERMPGGCNSWAGKRVRLVMAED